MKTVFLDRDGVINSLRPNDYVKNWKEFEFLPDAIDAICRLTDKEYQLIIVTNQACVNKGILQAKKLDSIHEKMLDQIGMAGGKIDAIYYCPHEDKDNCFCRKPKPGLLEKALVDFCVDSTNRFLVGDSLRDIVAGQKVNCKTCLVGENVTNNQQNTKTVVPDQTASNLMAATSWIIHNTK